MKSHFLQYLSLKKVLPILGLNTLHQLVLALGTLALVNAGLNIDKPRTFIVWILVALLAHLIEPVFHILIRPLEVILSFSGYRKFLSEKLLSNTAQPRLWTLKDKKENYLASIGTETDSYLAAMILVSLDIFSSVLSLSLGVLVLGLTLDMAFIPAFALSGILSFVIYQSMKDKVKTKSNEEQEARTQLSGYLLHSWENILFKNKELIKSYTQNLEKNFFYAQDKSIISNRWAIGFVSLLSTVSSLPVLAAMVLVLCKESHTTEMLAALLVTIPRQLNMLTTFRFLFQNATSFIAFDAKFKTLSENATLQTDIDLTSRIRLKDIAVSGINQDIYAELKEHKKGRFTVRAVNGAGKSTMLLHLNEQLSGSFYLPAHPQFLIDGKVVQRSTGQALLQHLEQARLSTADYILLDEWDANLDDENQDRLNSLIEEISQQKVVIEVRHRT